MKMNIEEIKYLKNKVMPVCRTFFISTLQGLEDMEKLAC